VPASEVRHTFLDPAMRLLARQIKRLKKKKTDVLLQERFEKYRRMGVFNE